MAKAVESKPSSKSAFRLATFVVEATTSDAVPVATVEINWLPWMVLAVAIVPKPVAIEPELSAPELCRYLR